MAVPLKHVMIITAEREFWLRASDFTCTEPDDDGTFTVDLFVRGRRIGQFSCVIGVYLSQEIPEFSVVRDSAKEDLTVPGSWIS